MANTPTNDLMFAKLAARYPSAKRTLGDLLAAYQAEYNGGRPFTAAQWFARHGGVARHAGDRAQAFWANWNPVTGG